MNFLQKRNNEISMMRRGLRARSTVDGQTFESHPPKSIHTVNTT